MTVSEINASQNETTIKLYFDVCVSDDWKIEMCPYKFESVLKARELKWKEKNYVSTISELIFLCSVLGYC